MTSFQNKIRKDLKRAMEKDCNQWLINELTPDRGYPFPMDNVLNLLSQYYPQDFPPSPVKTARTDSADTHAASGKTKKGEGG